MKKQDLLFITLSLFLCFNLQAQAPERKGEEVLKNATKTIYKEITEVKNSYVEIGGNYQTSKERISKGAVEYYQYQAKIWLEYPKQIKLKTLTTYPDNQQELRERIINNQEIFEKDKIKMPNGGGFIALEESRPGDPQKLMQKAMARLKYEAFSLTFPISLKFGDGLEFNFVGVAKAGEQKADMLETILADSYKIKLFFDQETRLLLMMTAQFFDEKLNSNVEQKFFFSEYKEENGLTFAHKVVIQENGQVVEERQIKLVTLNQALTPDFFAVKK